jgi:hypothetical protein
VEFTVNYFPLFFMCECENAPLKEEDHLLFPFAILACESLSTHFVAGGSGRVSTIISREGLVLVAIFLQRFWKFWTLINTPQFFLAKLLNDATYPLTAKLIQSILFLSLLSIYQWRGQVIHSTYVLWSSVKATHTDLDFWFACLNLLSPFTFALK